MNQQCPPTARCADSSAPLKERPGSSVMISTSPPMTCFQRCFFCLCLLCCCLDTLLGYYFQDEAGISQGLGDLGAEFHSPRFDSGITVPNGPCIETIGNEGTTTPWGAPETSLIGGYWFGQQSHIALPHQSVSQAEEIDSSIAPGSSTLNLKLDVDRIATYCSTHNLKSHVQPESSNLELAEDHHPPKTFPTQPEMHDINALYPPEISRPKDDLEIWAAIGNFQAFGSQALGPKNLSQSLWSLVGKLDKKLNPRSREINRSLGDFSRQLSHRTKLVTTSSSGGFINPKGVLRLESLSIKLIPARLDALQPNGEIQTLVRISSRQSEHFEAVRTSVVVDKVMKLLRYVVATYRFSQERGDGLSNTEYTQAELIQWFWNLIFERSDEGLPLFGWAALTYPIENPEGLFGDVKKALAKTLSEPEGLKSMMPVCISISLLSYWYQTTAHKNGDFYFQNWRHFMGNLIEALRDD